MRNIEINSGAVKRLLAVGLLALTVSGCGSEKESEVVSPIKMTEENQIDHFDEKTFELWETSEDYDTIIFPDRKELELYEKDYALLVDVYQENADSSWYKLDEKPSVMYISEGSDSVFGTAEVGTEFIEDANSVRFKYCVVGWTIVPAEFEKIDGKWKKYISDSEMYYDDEVYKTTVWREVPISNTEEMLDEIYGKLTNSEENKKLVKQYNN